MITEGFWANYKTGKIIEIPEHEQWVRAGKNYKLLGVSDAVMKAAAKFNLIRDREKFLLFLMQNAPIMRIRGHGTSVTFEYASRSRSEPLDMIWMWGKRNAGPFTRLNISNLATSEFVEMNYHEFEEFMEEGSYEAVMRVASIRPLKRRIAAELLRLSKQILQASLMFLLCNR